MAVQTCSIVSHSADCLTATLARIALADDEALAEFYDSTSSLVYSLVQRILGNPALAEEVTLDIYMQVWRQAEQYNPERAAPKPGYWLSPAAAPSMRFVLPAAKEEINRSTTLC